MVGGEGGPGGAAAELTAGLREAYDAAAPAWTHGAERVYLPLAQALVGQVEVAGRRVLDLGAGTGVAGRAALAAQLAAAGFGQVRIRPVTVRTGLAAPAELAAWRLGMAHVAPFISSLQARDAAAARQAAERAVAASAAGPLTVSLLVATAS